MSAFPRLIRVLLAVLGPSLLASCGDKAGNTEASSAASGGGAASTSASTGGQGGGTSGSGGFGGQGPAAGWPDETNTGIPAGACAEGLKPATNADLTPESGAQIQCVHFLDAVPYIGQEVSGVTYRSCRFEMSAPQPDAFVNVQGANVTIEDSEFIGGVETWIRTSYNGDGLEVRRCEFTGMANAVEFGNKGVVIEDNFVHDFGSVQAGQHADGIQTDGASQLVVRHNTVLLNAVDGATAAIGLWATLGDLNDALVENNLVAGGGYTVYPGVEQGGAASNVRFIGNHFSTQFNETCGEFGPKYPSNLSSDLVWQGNVWHDGPSAGDPIE